MMNINIPSMTVAGAYCTNFLRLSDMQAFIGKELGITNWMPITQERINNFSAATDDYQWIHTNPSIAKVHSPYQKTIAHGFLVLSLASKFCYAAYRIRDAIMGINYGLDKVRFHNVVPEGSLLRGRVSLMDYESKPKGARIKVKVVFELKDNDKPACTAEYIGECYVA